VHAGFWWGNLSERDHLEDLGVDGGGGNVKMDLQEVGWRDMDWIDLAPNRDKWRAVVYTVMNIRVPQHSRYFLTG
jgi:hypothetical protein